jgi:hypothetical protein
MNLEDASRSGLSQLQEGAGVSLPNTVQGMIDLFGGGKAGTSALARELADVRGVQYKSARRNLERYTTGAGEKRTPKELMDDLRGIAQRKVNQQTAEAMGGRRVEATFAGDVQISKDLYYKTFTVTLDADELKDFLEEAMGHNWKAAADELSYTLLNAYDMGRGQILGPGNGAIASVDTLSFSFV